LGVCFIISLDFSRFLFYHCIFMLVYFFSALPRRQLVTYVRFVLCLLCHLLIYHWRYVTQMCICFVDGLDLKRSLSTECLVWTWIAGTMFLYPKTYQRYKYLRVFLRQNVFFLHFMWREAFVNFALAGFGNLSRRSQSC
jgi:hypothetical protein